MNTDELENTYNANDTTFADDTADIENEFEDMFNNEDNVVQDNEANEDIDDESDVDTTEDYKHEFAFKEPTNDPKYEPNMKNDTLTVYERTAMIGLRAQQISEGALSFLPFEEAKSIMNPLLIAEEEFKRGYIVYDIVRKIPFGNHIREVRLEVNNGLSLGNVGNMI